MVVINNSTKLSLISLGCNIKKVFALWSQENYKKTYQKISAITMVFFI